MVPTDEFYKEIDKIAKGRRIAPVSKAILAGRARAMENHNVRMGQAFSVYVVIMGALNGVFEDVFVDIKDKILPTPYMTDRYKQRFPKKKNQDKKKYQKYINAKIREGVVTEDGKDDLPAYPFVSPVTQKAISQFNPNAYEEWASKHMNGDTSLISNTIDSAVSELQSDYIRLRYSIKNEMDKMRLPESEIKSQVYAFCQLASLVEEFHLALMLIGTPESWVDLLEDCNFLNTVKRVLDGEDIHSFDPLYRDQMNDGLCYWNIRHAEELCWEVCGKWTHAEDGNVEVGLEAIRRRVTNSKFLEATSNKAIEGSEEYEKELKQIHSMWLYSSGTIPFGIVHLDVLRMMNEGKTDEEIEKWLRTDKFVHVNNDTVRQLLFTVIIIRASEAGRFDLEAWNEKYRSIVTGKEKDPRTEKDREELQNTFDVDNLDDMRKAVYFIGDGLKKAKEKKVAEDAIAEAKKQEETEKRRIQEDPLLRLSQKFNVTAARQKPVKNQQKPKRTDKIQAEPNAITKENRQEPIPVVEATPVPDVEANAPTASPEIEQPMELHPTPPETKHTSVPWSFDEEEYLRKSWGKVSMEVMQKHLWRTEGSIRSKAYRLLSAERKKKSFAKEPQIKFNE